MTMHIIIPTYGRATWEQQHTARALVKEGITPTLVIQERESECYTQLGFLDCNVLFLPPQIQTVSPTRDYMVHEMQGDDKVVFLDDDLHFAARRADDTTKFRQMRDGELRVMLAAVENQLDHQPMVGVGAREGGNRNIESRLFNTRIMRVMGFRRSYLKKHHIYFSALEVMEDFHVALQILRSGSDICVVNDWVSNQAGGSGAPGGCSSYRTPALQSACARKLAALHPGLVRVVQKATKGAWGGGVRDDVIVQWKKARGET